MKASISGLSYKTKTIMQMMDAIKKNTPATRIKPRYKSVGSPPFTEKKCSIFHKSSGLKIIKKLNRSKRISHMLSMYNTSFLLILKIQIKKRISRQIIMPNLCANRNNFNSKPPKLAAPVKMLHY